MADDRHYTITIYDKTGSNVSPIAGEKKGGKETKTDSNSGDVALGWMVVQKVANYVKRAISFEISMVSLRTGEVERQQRMQFTYDILGQVSDAITNISVGALTGGGVGAVVATAYTAVEASINIGQKIIRYNTQRSLENISLGLARIRSGNSLAYINGNR
jgi:hypothetical protein